MAYELEALETGQRLALHASDWGNLLGLANRCSWRLSSGLDSYVGGGKRIISPSEARALAGAPEGPLGDLPPERRQELRPTEAIPGQGPVVETSLSGPGVDYESHFAWQRRWIVKEVVRLCRWSTVRVRPV